MMREIITTLKELALQIITKKGLSFGNYTISWILVAGLFISLTSLGWAVSFKKSISEESGNDAAISQEDEEAAGLPESAEEESADGKTTKKGTKKSGADGTSTGDGEQAGTADGQATIEGEPESITRNLVALGDSITRAVSPSSSLVGDNPSYSFSTGTNIGSVYLHLKNGGENINPVNLAVGGAKSANVLSSQVPQVAGYNPKYITLLVGGNDMLSLLSGDPVTPAQFQANLSTIASQITASGRKVLIGTIPNYSVMWQAGYPACGNYPYPPALVAAAIGQYNAAISSVASQYGLTLVNLYPYLGTGDISDYDCLHPNLSGQAKIANRFIAGL